MKVLVTGGRDYDDWENLCEVLDFYSKELGVSLFIHGGCLTGADAMTTDWCIASGMPCLIVPAKVKKYGASAGPRRNTSLLGFGAKSLIAFPGGKGTRDMINKAQNAGMVVYGI